MKAERAIARTRSTPRFVRHCKFRVAKLVQITSPDLIWEESAAKIRNRQTCVSSFDGPDVPNCASVALKPNPDS